MSRKICLHCVSFVDEAEGIPAFEVLYGLVFPNYENLVAQVNEYRQVGASN